MVIFSLLVDPDPADQNQCEYKSTTFAVKSGQKPDSLKGGFRPNGYLGEENILVSLSNHPAYSFTPVIRCPDMFVFSAAFVH
jgi:hypothetical protein